ncbi:2-C-methyl-D-erythritol 2 [Forsythia ovata]|uniref:2-C-methyl-D-erythritol 2 n=1 Tax=Forsythia ovata TaxID=205694 RepID=A0ABD1WUK3_9LAMI
MAMATSIHYTTPILNKILSKLHHQHKPSSAYFTWNSVFLSLQSTVRNSSSLASAATSAVEAETQKPSVTLAKLLPFRVGHGFDLHRLEPGYLLIIGGINISHDRGCEAHSDGFEDECKFEKNSLVQVTIRNGSGINGGVLGVEIEFGMVWWFVYARISYFLVLFAGIKSGLCRWFVYAGVMSGLTLGLMIWA